MRLAFAGLGLAAALVASAAHAESEKGSWVFINSPHPGYQRFKTAVRVDTLRREGDMLNVEFFIAERGDRTPQGEQKIAFVMGDVRCGDFSSSHTYLRITMSAGDPVRELSKEIYERGGNTASSLSGPEAEIAALFCNGVPKGEGRIDADSGTAGFAVLEWLRRES